MARLTGYFPKFGVITVLLCARLLVGCADQKVWKYGPETTLGGAPLLDKTVVVTSFNDQRRNDNDNMIAMYMLPFMPYGWQELDTPEGIADHMNTSDWSWRPSEDIAKATAEELNNAAIFKEVFYGVRAGEGDLVLQGRILSTRYDAKMFSYGLSFAGPVLWFIGFPFSNVSNELVLVFKLEDRKQHKTLWQKSYRAADSNTSWVYYLRPDFHYPDMLKKILLDVVWDIRAEAPAIRSALPKR